MLAFGTEVVIPFEIGIPSLWVLGSDVEQNLEHLRANLYLIDEVQTNAELKLAHNQ